jgi:hypothetical protein
MRGRAGGLERRAPVQEPGEVGVQAVVDEVDPRPGAQAVEVLGVGAGAGDHEARVAHLALEQPGGVEGAAVDVLGVSRERVGQPEQPGGEPGDRRRAVSEVGVQVGDAPGRVDAVGEGHRLQ